MTPVYGVTALLCIGAGSAWGQALISVMPDPPVVTLDTQTVVVRVQAAGSPSKVTFESVLRPGVEQNMTGDATGTYTISLPVAPFFAALRFDDVYREFIGYIRPYNGAQSARYNIFIDFADFPESFPSTLDVPAAAQHTEYAVNLVIPSAFPPAGLPSSIPDQSTVTRRFYQLYPDNFDVLNIVYFPSFFQNRFHSIVRNPVSGIGVPAVDRGSTYGSAKRLQGISVFPLAGFFDGAGVGMQHEFGHQWINYLNIPPLAGAIPHWPFSTMASGVMGFSIPPSGEGGNFPCLILPEGSGIRLVPNPDQPVYGDLDLYLMGLLPASQVGEQIVLDRQDSGVISLCNGQPYPGTFTRLHVSDIIANPNIGPRIPASDNAPKDFRMATILVTRDELLSPEAMSLYSLMAKRAELSTPAAIHEGFVKATMLPFAQNTRGLATMTARLSSTPTITAVANGASFLDSALAPGSFVTIFGSLLASARAGASVTPLPTTLGGTQVFVNGAAAPLYYSSPGQINFQLPYETPVGPTAVKVTVNGLEGSAVTIQTAPAVPGILTYGQNRAVAQNSDNTLNGASNGAIAGSVITVYLTGIGELDNPVATGTPAPLTPLSQAKSPASATIGGQSAQIQFLGLTPGFVGLAQANIQTPALPSGNYPIVILTGAASSNQPLIAIR